MSKNSVIDKLNRLLADLNVMYVKLHNFHWNVKGAQFFRIHQLMETYYEYFAGKSDEVAERILQLGGKPFSSMKDYLENARLNELPAVDFSAPEIISSVTEDFSMLLKDLKEISASAGQLGDSGTQMLADDFVAWLEKNLWMLKSFSG